MECKFNSYNAREPVINSTRNTLCPKLISTPVFPAVEENQRKKYLFKRALFFFFTRVINEVRPLVIVPHKNKFRSNCALLQS